MKKRSRVGKARVGSLGKLTLLPLSDPTLLVIVPGRGGELG
jgi:hypothetical protein